MIALLQYKANQQPVHLPQPEIDLNTDFIIKLNTY